MGRFMRWLKQLLTGRKEGRKTLEENRVGSDGNDGPGKEKKRWSFAKQRRSEVDGGGTPTGHHAAVVDASAESPSPLPLVKSSFRRDEEEEDVRGREEKAAVLIQKTFRGYLARKALRALRSLVKIQALVRGYLVRKQTAMTLRRLQTLVRLQADSIAVKNNASYRRSMEQVRISAHEEMRLNPPSTPVHRRRLSDSTDSNYERSPRIVEMDTCHLRSRSSRMAGRYTPDHPTTEYHHRPAAALQQPPASCSPLPGKLQPARLSFRRTSHEHNHERDHWGSKTAHHTPRFAPSAHHHHHQQQPYDSPAKSVVEYGTTPRRTPCRDALVSPRYMAGTASSAARTRCHSAPRQRQQQQPAAEAAARTSLAHRAGSRRPSCCPHAHAGVCSQCSDASRRAGGCSDLSVDDEAAARDYYLDSLW
ncbi:hypothetical protein PR202_ga09705 [Eleusine coracana subsp. coracana]|uniref:DUF4005 domain-containing protein n=1 Tax=Eleusine coracana subsp. coracana TaxID=191504 RepID=A0AAV5C5J2_ELECO|nr:hypothetical protein QOZ80_1AG0032740 [Eleusine coracana subsp. coracana]GJM93174.1 hypothetical protein PR202_ga09705 [Eleusine coracana subsp. coracana]